MTDKPSIPPPGLSLGDIYYVLFRHKWKILLISACGLIGAALLPLVWPRPFQSEAKLFVKYVVENKTPAQLNANDARVKSPDDRGENIINSELEILTSLDLALEVATNVGPEKVLGKGGGADPYKAGLIIHKNSLPEVPKKSNVIRIVFQHSDPTVVQPVLNQLIGLYLKRSAEIHRSVGVYDEFLSKQTDEVRARLAEINRSLENLKTNSPDLFLGDARKMYDEQINKLQQEMIAATVELAGLKAELAALSGAPNPPLAAPKPGEGGPAPSTNPLPSTLNSLARQSQATAAQLSTNVPADKTDQYKRICSRLDALEKKEQELLLQFTPENSWVKSVREQIVDALKSKKQLEDEYPGLVAPKATDIKTALAEPSPAARINLLELNAKISALEARTHDYNQALEIIRGNRLKAAALESLIAELQRKKDNEENNYKSYSGSLDQARTDALLAALRDSNINLIQLPSPPFRDSTKLQKAMVGLFLGGIAAALGLAFLIELYLDRSIRRPREIEIRIGLPLFISIPRLASNGNGNGKVHLLKPVPRTPLLPETTALATEEGREKKGAEPEAVQSPESRVQSGVSSPQPSPQSGEGGSRIQDPASGVQLPTLNPLSSIASATVGQLPTSSPSAHRGEGRGEVAPISTPPSAPSPHGGEGRPALHSASDEGGGEVVPLPSTAEPSAPAPWDADHALHPFWDALRDRLITYFEIKNLTHKPKLVAVTSCNDGSGVTTIAAGLAASLSETGDGNVLLVDMNQQQGAAHQFYRGNLALGLDEALESQKREDALVQENLYVVKEATNGDKLPRVLPKRFMHLVPKLKASDYDYIIFDMPPISQISVTPHLARFMDIVFMVVESEKTDRDVVKRAADYLSQAKGNVGIILNKTHTYVPKLLHQEI